MKVLINYIILGVFIVCISYSQQTSNNSITVKSNGQEQTDTIIKDIPAYFQTTNWKNYSTKVFSKLNIKSIEDGVDEWEIRLWIAQGYRAVDSTQLLIFRKADNIISGKIFVYTNSITSDSHKETDFSYYVKPITPKLDWSVFIDSVKKLGIYTLPDYSKINGYILATDSDGVTVEIATKNSYRVYEYLDFSENIKKIPEAIKINSILTLIQDQFDLNVFY